MVETKLNISSHKSSSSTISRHKQTSDVKRRSDVCPFRTRNELNEQSNQSKQSSSKPVFTEMKMFNSIE